MDLTRMSLGGEIWCVCYLIEGRGGDVLSDPGMGTNTAYQIGLAFPCELAYQRPVHVAEEQQRRHSCALVAGCNLVRERVAAGEAGAVFGKFGMESRFSPESA